MSSSKSVTIGGLRFGGGAPVRVESMLKSRLEDVDACMAEMQDLHRAGCELVRVAYPDESLGPNLARLAESSCIPIMADIHFNYCLAVSALACGCGSIRINPGNMSGREGLSAVVSAAKDAGAAIRIGSNGGSLNRNQLDACGGDRALALVRAVEEQLSPLVETGFENVILSAKSSSVRETVIANTILSQRYPYPLHVGITEAGPGMDGAVKSAAGLGILLGQGIGDTMRVSLTGPSADEVTVAYGIQRALGIRERGVNIVSCPGCGRRRVDVFSLVERVRAVLPHDLPDGTVVAVMGCEVNGPKEAASADIGVAGTQKGFVLFKKGLVVATGEAEELETALETYLE